MIGKIGNKLEEGSADFERYVSKAFTHKDESMTGRFENCGSSIGDRIETLFTSDRGNVFDNISHCFDGIGADIKALGDLN